MTNLERARKQMEAKKCDALLVSDLGNVQWLTGFSGSNGFAILTPEQAIFITDGRYITQSKAEVKGFDIDIYTTPRTEAQAISEACNKVGVKSIGFESQTTTYAAYERWKDALGGVSLEPTTKLLEGLIQIKTADEIEKIRKACQLADACFTYLTPRIQAGVREWDLQLELEFYLRRQMAELAFDPIVVSGVNGARPHGRATDKIMQKGELVTLDFGAKLEGYCSDLTRTVAIGEPSDQLREMYEWTLKSQLAALEMMKPGVAAKDIDAKSRAVLDEKGLAKYFTHGLGHGLGRLVHDQGSLSSRSSDILEPGQVWTVEPGVYIEGVGGVRIEDDVVVTETGIEILTTSPKELLIL